MPLTEDHTWTILPQRVWASPGMALQGKLKDSLKQRRRGEERPGSL